MAEKSESVNLGEDVGEGSILNVTQDDFISTNLNESMDNTTHELTIETVDAKVSDNVNIFNQLALIMEMMSGMKTEINDKLDKQDEKMKSENNNLNTSLNEFKNEIKSEVSIIHVKLTDLNNEFINVSSELRASEIYMNSRLESMNEVIVGVKDELTSDINKIQTEMKNDIKIINEKQKEKMLETNKKFDTLTSKFNDKFKKQNDKIDCNVQCIINECEQMKRASEIQENINDEFRSNFEQVDAIKINVTSLKNKQAEHLSLIHI